MKTLILVFAAGFCIGMLMNELLLYLKRRAGTLKIDQINSDKDIYRIEIDDLDGLPKKKFIILKIDANADLSQK